MNDVNERFSILRPLTNDEGKKLIECILYYFSPLNNSQLAEFLGLNKEKGKVALLPSFDLLTYINFRFPEMNAFRYLHHIRSLTEILEAKGALVHMGASGNAILPKNYHSLIEFTTKQRLSHHWLSEYLGGGFIYEYFNKYTVQVVGENVKTHAEHAGTGVVISDNIILTCKHVLAEMDVYDKQNFQGNEVRIERKVWHPHTDVGLIITEPNSLQFDNAICFREPKINDEVYILGYPPIPFSQNSVSVMQKGEVTVPAIKSLDHHDLFLFSAIARPGNSGGPIIAKTGEIVGIVTKEIAYENGINFPFFAGIPSKSIETALDDMDFKNILPIEDYQ